jgi:hypothetical protein
MLVENAVLPSLFVILSNLRLITNLFAFSLKFRALGFRLALPRTSMHGEQPHPALSPSTAKGLARGCFTPSPAQSQINELAPFTKY